MINTRRQAKTLGFALAGIHLVVSSAIFAFYFLSTDPQAALVFVYLLPLDPWFFALSDVVSSEIGLAVLTVTLGTLQWFVLGWAIAKAASWLRAGVAVNE